MIWGREDLKNPLFQSPCSGQDQCMSPNTQCFCDLEGHSWTKQDGEKSWKAKLDVLQGPAQSIMTDDMHPVFPVSTGDE